MAVGNSPMLQLFLVLCIFLQCFELTTFIIKVPYLDPSWPSGIKVLIGCGSRRQRKLLYIEWVRQFSCQVASVSRLLLFSSCRVSYNVFFRHSRRAYYFTITPIFQLMIDFLHFSVSGLVRPMCPHPRCAVDCASLVAVIDCQAFSSQSVSYSSTQQWPFWRVKASAKPNVASNRWVW